MPQQCVAGATTATHPSVRRQDWCPGCQTRSSWHCLPWQRQGTTSGPDLRPWLQAQWRRTPAEQAEGDQADARHCVPHVSSIQGRCQVQRTDFAPRDAEAAAGFSNSTACCECQPPGGSICLQYSSLPANRGPAAKLSLPIMATPHLEHVSQAHAAAGHLVPPIPESQGVDCIGHAVGDAKGDAGRDGRVLDALGRRLQVLGVQRADVGLHAEGGHGADAADGLGCHCVGSLEVLFGLQQQKGCGGTRGRSVTLQVPACRLLEAGLAPWQGERAYRSAAAGGLSVGALWP